MLKINTCAYPKLVLRRLIKSKKCHFIASLEKNVIAKKKTFITWKKKTQAYMQVQISQLPT